MIQDLDHMKAKLHMYVFEKIVQVNQDLDQEVTVQEKDHHQRIVQQDAVDHVQNLVLEVVHCQDKFH